MWHVTQLKWQFYKSKVTDTINSSYLYYNHMHTTYMIILSWFRLLKPIQCSYLYFSQY